VIRRNQQFFCPSSGNNCYLLACLMIEVRTSHFRLRLELNLPATKPCRGNYFIVLVGTMETDKKKSFKEAYGCDSYGLPFYTLKDAAAYAEELAAFWKLQLMANPKLNQTGIQELGGIWRKFSIAIHPAHRGYDKWPVYTFSGLPG
jgi:hypothetical protein